MSCPTQCILGENLTFTTQALDSANLPVDATGDVTYKVYADSTNLAVLSGTMSKLDDDNTVGFYSEQIACTSANDFERFESYTVRISATVSGSAVVATYSFICMGADDTPTGTSGALTTTAAFYAYTGIEAGTDEALIEDLIARATSAMEIFCNRGLVSDTYREIYNGDHRTELNLREYPVSAIRYISVGLQQPSSISNSSADAWSALVAVTATTMTLAVNGGAGDGTSTLTLADYTITTLAAAINALGSGWSATFSGNLGVWSAAELLEQGGFDSLNNPCTPKIPNSPLSNYRLDDEAGIVHLSSGYWHYANRYMDSCSLNSSSPSFYVGGYGPQSIIIRYTAGYVTTPADLEQICIDLTNTYYQSRAIDSTVKREKLGDHDITYKDTGAGGSKAIPDALAQRLARYKRPIL
jgi:hypothetical protein